MALGNGEQRQQTIYDIFLVGGGGGGTNLFIKETAKCQWIILNYIFYIQGTRGRTTYASLFIYHNNILIIQQRKKYNIDY